MSDPGMSTAHAAAIRLDQLLGDPQIPGTPFSYQAAVAGDDHDEIPAGAVDTLRQLGFADRIVPAAFGGKLRTLEDLMWSCRVVARRNPSIAVMYGSTLLGSMAVWLWGSPAQRDELARAIRAGDHVAFAISEADHGSDLAATEAIVGREADELFLTGTKWPVGNASRARYVTTLARHRDDPRFSLLLVDKQTTDNWNNLPPVRTLGLRGHDLSGITFTGSRLPADAVIGRSGFGLGQILKLLQVTRTAVAALSLGTMDAVTRIALSYAQARQLYGQPIYALPAIRDQLVKAHVDLLIADCVAFPVARALTVAPGRLSLWSSIVKYLVPVDAENVVASMGNVLGARGYLREGVADGAFQKLQRDHAIASVFEGTTHVNLHNVAHQLPYVLAGDAPPTDQKKWSETLAALFSRTVDAPTWQPDGRQLQLTNEGHDEISHSWEQIAEDVHRLASAPAATAAHRDLASLVSDIDRLRAGCYASVHTDGWEAQSMRAFSLAAEHCVYHAAASCLLTWLHNRDVLGGHFADGDWLILCLSRLLQRLQPKRQLPEPYLWAVEQPMLASLHDGGFFTPATLATLQKAGT